MEVKELKKILDDHLLWLKGKGGGKANLIDANLSGADLIDANLRSADLSGADIDGAYIDR